MGADTNGGPQMALWRLLSRLLRRTIGAEYIPALDVVAKTREFGRPPCRWTVVDHDGLRRCIVYCAGVGADLSFEHELMREFSARVFAFDPTPRSIAWLQTQEPVANFRFAPLGLAGFDGELELYPPLESSHVSFSCVAPAHPASAQRFPVRRLASLMALLGHEAIGLLKMDIEGSEFGVIADLVAGPVRPDQILVEFHHRLPGVGWSATRDALKRLRSAGYLLFSVSRSNEEYGFVRAALIA